MLKPLATSSRTHTTALVIVPPEECWPPIQALRERYDPLARRWMPHITLVYPFLPRPAWGAALPRIAAACASVAPFSITLGGAGEFAQRGGRVVVWLAPEPAAPLVALYTALAAALPPDPTQHGRLFTPHLTVGRSDDAAQREAVRLAVRATWMPLTFTASEVALLWRNEPPDDVFRVGERVALGAQAQKGGDGATPAED
jgi:2'-5' RNA ligase